MKSIDNKKRPKTEFRYNKKRQHYSYIYKFSGNNRHNLLLSSKSTRKVKKHGKTKVIKNVKLIKHPNPNKPNEASYLMVQRYVDDKDDFDYKINNWSFDPMDRIKIKRIKKGKWK